MCVEGVWMCGRSGKSPLYQCICMTVEMYMYRHWSLDNDDGLAGRGRARYNTRESRVRLGSWGRPTGRYIRGGWKGVVGRVSGCSGTAAKGRFNATSTLSSLHLRFTKPTYTDLSACRVILCRCMYSLLGLCSLQNKLLAGWSRM